MKWKEFFLEDVAIIKNGVRLTKADMNIGDIPFIGASESNNGVTAFTSTINNSYDRNVLGVNYNGSVGFSFYHPYDAIFSDDVKRVIWKDQERNNKYTLLFLSTIIGQQKDKYAYGYKFNGQRMKRQKVLLPVNAENEINWSYMEDYMRGLEKELLTTAINNLCKQLIINDIISGGGNLYPRWKEFYFTEVFTRIQRGKRLTKANQHEGSVPYVSSTAFNNGVDGFISNENNVRSFHNCLTIANSGSVGSSFFHHYKFVASDHVTSLEREGLDKYAYLFMVPMINRLSEKYSFNREINDERIRREKILLPVTENGEIDFKFMSNLMRQIEKDILNVTLSHFKKKLSVNKCEWGGVKWRNFVLNEVFTILVPGKSKGLNHLTQVDKGGVNYLGATNLNNGVLGYVLPIHQQVQKGNCIAFIRNGEGSMGYSVYKEEDFIATSDITLGYNPNLNRYTGMFITTIADRVRGKYNFGYKRNSHRLSKEVLTLPINAKDEIDWSFMELFMRSIENEQIMSYLKTKGFIH